MRKTRISASKEQIIAIIDNWILNQRNREIVKRNVIDGIHYEPLGEEFGLSRNQIYNIVTQGITVIMEHL